MPEISDTDHQKRGDKPSLYEGLVLNTIRRHQPVTAGNLYQLVNASPVSGRNMQDHQLHPIIDSLSAKGWIISHARRGGDWMRTLLVCSGQGENILHDWIFQVRADDLISLDPFRVRIQALDLLSFEERMDWISRTKEMLKLMVAEMSLTSKPKDSDLSMIAQSDALGIIASRIDWLHQLAFDIVENQSRTG